MIFAYACDTATHTYKELTPEEFRCCGPVKQDGRVLWIDLESPTPEEEQFVFTQFLPVHPLTLEDVTRLRREPDAPPHFPKVEEFHDYLFVIVNPLTGEFMRRMKQEDGEENVRQLFTQLSAIVTDRVLITHHYEHMSCIETLRTHLQRHTSQMERGPDYLFHLVLDSTVDQFAPVLDHVDETLDDMESTVVMKPEPSLFLSILRLKREIMHLRKTLIYEREVLVRLARGEFELVDERETVYYRNVYDHLVRFTELIESSRDLASDLLQSFQASTGNRLNQIMKVLTMISTIILPMTLISGIYGMNVKSLPGAEEWWGFPLSVVLMLASGAIGLGFFWWRRWL
jgi:magnesium transporter